MSRGLFVLAIQLLLCGATAYLGVWTLTRPKSFQAFVHENFGLLPSVKSGTRITPFLIRLSSVYFLWYPSAYRTPTGRKSCGSPALSRAFQA